MEHRRDGEYLSLVGVPERSESRMSSRAAAVRNAGVALPQWVWPVLALALAVLYAVTFDAGFVSARVADSSMYLHELFHDGRHLLGVPCQ
jgi:putative cobalt transporter subunit CbtB